MEKWALTPSFSARIRELNVRMSTARRFSGGGSGILKLLLLRVMGCLGLFTIHGWTPGFLLPDAVHARPRIDIVVDGPISAFSPVCQGPWDFFERRI